MPVEGFSGIWLPVRFHSILDVEGGCPVAGELPFNQSRGVLRSLASLGLLIGGLTSRDHPCEPENASRYRGKGEAPPLKQFKMH